MLVLLALLRNMVKLDIDTLFVGKLLICSSRDFRFLLLENRPVSSANRKNLKNEEEEAMSLM